MILELVMLPFNETTGTLMDHIQSHRPDNLDRYAEQV